jgi:hypothetical protein
LDYVDLLEPLLKQFESMNVEENNVKENKVEEKEEEEVKKCSPIMLKKLYLILINVV